MAQFLKRLLFNIVFLGVIGMALLFIFPDIMKQVYQFFGALFGPLAILMVIVFALPNKRRRR